MRRRLEAVAVGPQKTATTWLARIIEASPNIASPREVKETFFWDANYARGLDWYFRHFAQTGASMEIAPTYFHNSEARQRLQAHNPDLKVIITLRDPAARAFSLYLHHKRKGRTGADFWQAAKQFPEILEAGHYRHHVAAWIEAFGPERVLVLTQEQISSTPPLVIDRLSRFLSWPLASQALAPGEKVNAGGMPASAALAGMATKIAEGLRRFGLYRVINFAKALGLKRLVYGRDGRALPKLKADDRARLVALYEADIAYVERLLEVELPNWRTTGSTDGEG